MLTFAPSICALSKYDGDRVWKMVGSRGLDSLEQAPDKECHDLGHVCGHLQRQVFTALTAAIGWIIDVPISASTSGRRWQCENRGNHGQWQLLFQWKWPFQLSAGSGRYFKACQTHARVKRKTFKNNSAKPNGVTAGLLWLPLVLRIFFLFA